MLFRNVYILLIFSFLLVGCSSSPTQVQPKVSLSTVQIAQFELALSYKLKLDRYYTEEEMKQYVLDKVADNLKEAGMLAESDDDFTKLYIEVDCYRAFTGEATPWPASSITRPIVNWSVRAEKSGEVVAQVSKTRQTYKTGLWGNLKTVMTQDLGNDNKESEHQYPDAVADTIAKWIIDRK